jgi:hypothetical protein
MASVALEGKDKAQLLLALDSAFSHSVPNSLVHRIATLDHAFRFYCTPVDVRTPYEKLHADQVRWGTELNRTL